MSDFLKIALSNSATRIADELANTKTTLPWLMSVTGAPVFLVPLLVPLRESLSMLPQLLLNPWLMQYDRRRHFWLAATIVQCICLLLFPLTLIAGNGLTTGLLVLLILTVYSLTRSMSSLNSKELAAKTIDADIQGQLNATTTWVSGLLVLLSGLLLVFLQDNIESGVSLTLVFSLAALVSLAGIIMMSLLNEKPGDTKKHSHLIRQAWHDLKTIRDDHDLRVLVVLRALLFFPVIGAPLLIVEMDTSAPGTMLGSLIIANGLAVSLSAPLWGKLADRSARFCLTASSILCVSALVLMLLFSQTFTYAPLLCLVLLVAGHSGIRIGRKTYVATIPDGNVRNRMIAVSNSLISILLLLAGIFSSMISLFSPTVLLLVLAIFGAAGTVASLRLKRETNV